MDQQNATSCKDLDECAVDNGSCQQTCTNFDPRITGWHAIFQEASDMHGIGLKLSTAQLLPGLSARAWEAELLWDQAGAARRQGGSPQTG